MAVVGLFDDDDDEQRKRRALSTPAQPGPQFNQTASFEPPRPEFGQSPWAPSDPPVGPPSPNAFNSPNPAPTDAAQAQMIDRDRASWEQRLREEAQKAGVGYDPSDLQGIVNFGSYAGNAGKDPMEAINNAIRNYAQRGANNTGTDANVPGAPAGTYRQMGGQSDAQQASGAMGWQPGGGTFERTATMFDDPGTSQLEQLLNRQMEALNKPNPQLAQLMDFLNKQFSELSTNPGFSPEELAIQRTQAFEPLEQYRQASKQRAIERTGARGFLPSSGLHELDLRDIDIGADRNRSALDRDLAIRGMDERKSDLAQALRMAQGGFDIANQDERNRFGDQLSRSSLLYELPRNAMRDSLAVLNATPGPESLFNQSVQLQQMQQQRDYINQQRNAQVWDSIGQWLPSLFGLFD